MNDRDPSHLEDMLAYARDARELLGGADAAALANDKMRRYAVLRAIEIIGEAAGKVSPEGREALPDIPWRQVIGMRNLLIHGYREVAVSTVVQTIHDDLPALMEALERALSDRGGEA